MSIEGFPTTNEKSRTRSIITVGYDSYAFSAVNSTSMIGVMKA